MLNTKETINLNGNFQMNRLWYGEYLALSILYLVGIVRLIKSSQLEGSDRIKDLGMRFSRLLQVSC